MALARRWQRADEFNKGRQDLTGVSMKIEPRENRQNNVPGWNADGAQAGFLHDLSHALRTPQHVMVGYNDMLLDGMFGPLRDEQLEALQLIRHHIVRLSATTLQLLDLLGPGAPLDENAVRNIAHISEEKPS
jgi:signal transduction histidine kinase